MIHYVQTKLQQRLLAYSQIGSACPDDKKRTKRQSVWVMKHAALPALQVGL